MARIDPHHFAEEHLRGGDFDSAHIVVPERGEERAESFAKSLAGCPVGASRRRSDAVVPLDFSTSNTRSFSSRYRNLQILCDADLAAIAEDPVELTEWHAAGFFEKFLPDSRDEG